MASERKPSVTCFVMAEAGLAVKPCCNSCHDDADEGYCGLLDLGELPDDLNGEETVCCANARDITPQEVEKLREYIARRTTR